MLFLVILRKYIHFKLSELSKKIAQLRQEYSAEPLTKKTVLKDPFKQFEYWFNEALTAELLEPNAMTLATASKEGLPSARTVLLKHFDEQGFTFFTNYGSKKSKQIEENPNVALLFAWLPLQRQVKIEGVVEKISTVESLNYFLSRPQGSQLGAWVSEQSSVISSRSVLANKLEEMKQKFKNGKIPLPSFWGGFKVIPSKIEFWQGQPSRLHDRILFTLVNDEWKIERLAP